MLLPFRTHARTQTLSVIRYSITLYLPSLPTHKFNSHTHSHSSFLHSYSFHSTHTKNLSIDDLIASCDNILIFLNRNQKKQRKEKKGKEKKIKEHDTLQKKNSTERRKERKRRKKTSRKQKERGKRLRKTWV